MFRNISISLVFICFFFSSNNAIAAIETIETLFVSNGYYQQETDIYNHLVDRGIFNVTVKKDYQIYGSTDLSQYDLIIITEFAPGIGYYGLQNIKNSGKPVLIVEYWDFWYSYKLDLVKDDWAGYYGTDTVDIIDEDHMITRPFDSTIEVYDSSYTIYGIPYEDIEDGVTPLIYSSEYFDEVAVISDDERKIVATGIYDTQRYSDIGWELFDQILAFLTPYEEIFEEGFEDGNLDDWTVTGNVQVTADAALEGQYGVQFKTSSDAVGITKVMDTRGYTDVSISYWAFALSDSSHTFEVWISVPGLVEPIRVDEFTGTHEWHLREITLPEIAEDEEELEITFLFVGDFGADQKTVNVDSIEFLARHIYYLPLPWIEEISPSDRQWRDDDGSTYSVRVDGANFNGLSPEDVEVYLDIWEIDDPVVGSIYSDHFDIYFPYSENISPGTYHLRIETPFQYSVFDDFVVEGFDDGYYNKEYHNWVQGLPSGCNSNYEVFVDWNDWNNTWNINFDYENNVNGFSNVEWFDSEDFCSGFIVSDDCKTILMCSILDLDSCKSDFGNCIFTLTVAHYYNESGRWKNDVLTNNLSNYNQVFETLYFIKQRNTETRAAVVSSPNGQWYGEGISIHAYRWGEELDDYHRYNIVDNFQHCVDSSGFCWDFLQVHQQNDYIDAIDVGVWKLLSSPLDLRYSF